MDKPAKVTYDCLVGSVASYDKSEAAQTHCTGRVKEETPSMHKPTSGRCLESYSYLPLDFIPLPYILYLNSYQVPKTHKEKLGSGAFMMEMQLTARQ